MINSVTLVGHVGKDPETRHTEGGTTVCNFTMATSETWKGEKKTEWHRIVAFKALAEICAQYITKGKLVYVQGKIQTREWTDKEGTKKFTTEIIAKEMRMLSGGAGDNKAQETLSQASQDQRGGQNSPEPIPNHGQGGDRGLETVSLSRDTPKEDDIPF